MQKALKVVVLENEPLETAPLAEYISFYRSLGLCVIPVVYGDKRPEIAWESFQKRKPTDAEIVRWFYNGKRHNIAIVCGSVSGNLVVLDFDDVSVYQRFFDAKKIERETIVVRTGGGKRHVYLRSTDPLPSFKVPQIRLEVRSDGNIVVAPPSLHPSGSRYEFICAVRKILEADDLLEALLQAAKEKFGVEPFQITERLEEFESAGAARCKGRAPPCIFRLLQGVNEGFRNEAAARLASYYLHIKGYTPARAWARLREWNTRNRPPLDERELYLVLCSIAKRRYTYLCRSLAAFCDRAHCRFIRSWWARRSVQSLLEEKEG
ncbi:bifunctional DNA primase/polymerase [Candidatus Hadarchaeum sp.]|uniref:bifunctional DNA primase/polymerase n=1 Tax=Candidatus Hadarchaeum sp. TaxID=2883567 RepID=UPI00319E5968